jgi:hypothetical protein
MLGLQYIGIRNASKENTGVAQSMALLEKGFDQRDGLSGSAAPYDVIAVANYPGEIEILQIYFLRHDSAAAPGVSVRRSIA